jgi:hypothetical protein
MLLLSTLVRKQQYHNQIETYNCSKTLIDHRTINIIAAETLAIESHSARSGAFPFFLSTLWKIDHFDTKFIRDLHFKL